MTDSDTPICSECKQPCTVKEIDGGIGSYEYCGYRGFDSRMIEVSTCCEADIMSAAEYAALQAEDE